MPLDSRERADKKDKPESPVALPSDRRSLLKVALDLIEQCRASADLRAAYCRQLYAIIETGRQDGSRSMINMLFSHIDRLASHLFSPTDLRFTVDFENDYPDNILKRGRKVANVLTRDWERNNTDLMFGQGVFEALRYGSCFLKQWVQQEGADRTPVYYSDLVMPWMFGVYREDQNNLSRQPALCETILLSLPEVWRRIYHLPNAEELYHRIKTHANKGQAGDQGNSFFHQILSTSTLNTGNVGNGRPAPGGIVQLNSDPNYAIMGPEIAVDIVKMHELWVWDGDDYTTIQVVEPDILIAPLLKKSNLLISGQTHSGLHPYTRICANDVHGYIWGRPEVVDLIEPQGWLSTTADDVRRLFGLQIDKILGFTGFDGLADENYDQRRAAGFFNGPIGATINDITPSFPAEALPMIREIMGIIDRIGGFDNLLSGRGEPGVRAGVHADTLMKTASPRLRDRSLLIERQCAAAADLRLSIMEAKDGANYWTDGTNEETIEKTRFMLSDIPGDRRVAVDSHSSSPIFADDHQNLISFGFKAGLVDPESAIEDLPFPQRDTLIHRLRAKEAKQEALQQELLKRDPEALIKIMSHKGKH